MDDSPLSELQKLLHGRLSRVQDAIDASVDYIDVIRELVIKDAPGALQEITGKVDVSRAALLAAHEGVAGLTPAAIVDTVTRAYDALGEASEVLAELGRVVDNETYLSRALAGGSTAYANEIIAKRTRAKQTLVDSRVGDDEIFHAAIDAARLRDNWQSVADVILKSKEVNRFVIALAAQVLHLADSDYAPRLRDLIERQKSAVLGAPVDRPETRAESVVLIHLPALGLVAEPLPMRANRHGSDDAPHDESLGVITVYKISPNSLSFHMRALTDSQYVDEHDLHTDPTHGLTKKILARYRTVIEAPQRPTALRFDIEVTGEDRETFSVRETLDGVNFRSYSYAGSARIPRSVIAPLLRLPRRPQAYHARATEAIIAAHSSVIDPRADQILSEYGNVDNNVINDVVKGHISEAALAAVMDSVKASIPSASGAAGRRVRLGTAETIMTFARRVHMDEVLYDQIIPALPEQYRRGETALTYAQKIDSLARVYQAEWENQLARVTITDLRLEEYHDDQQKYVRDTFAGAIGWVMREMDRTAAWSEFEITMRDFFIDRR